MTTYRVENLGVDSRPSVRSAKRGARLPTRVAGAALEQLYRAFFGRLVRRACWRYGLSKEDASEVVHDAFLLALVKLESEGNPRAWLYGVVDRLAANWKRKSTRRIHLMARWNPPARPVQQDHSAGDEAADFSEDLEGGQS